MAVAVPVGRPALGAGTSVGNCGPTFFMRCASIKELDAAAADLAAAALKNAIAPGRSSAVTRSSPSSIWALVSPRPAAVVSSCLPCSGAFRLAAAPMLGDVSSIGASLLCSSHCKYNARGASTPRSCSIHLPAAAGLVAARQPSISHQASPAGASGSPNCRASSNQACASAALGATQMPCSVSSPICHAALACSRCCRAAACFGRPTVASALAVARSRSSSRLAVNAGALG